MPAHPLAATVCALCASASSGSSPTSAAAPPAAPPSGAAAAFWPAAPPGPGQAYWNTSLNTWGGSVFNQSGTYQYAAPTCYPPAP